MPGPTSQIIYKARGGMTAIYGMTNNALFRGKALSIQDFKSYPAPAGQVVSKASESRLGWEQLGSGAATFGMLVCVR